LARLLDDPYSAVRYVAFESLRTLPGYADFEFDFDCPPDQRRQAANEALSRWGGPDRTPKSALLLGNDGKVDWGKANELLGKRDDRDIRIVE
jgi:hypothetical protein